MPGGSRLILFLQKVFWATAIFSIIFIGAFLFAIHRSGHKKHPVIIGFMITSWFTAWIALLPFFGNVWEYAISRPLIHANVRVGPPHTVCQFNAVLLAYFWTAIPGFGLAFVIEVMRMLLEFLKFSRIDYPENENLKKPIAGSGFRRKGSVDSNCSEISQGTSHSSDSQNITLTSLESINEEHGSLHSNQSVSRSLKKLWQLHWKKSIIFLPLITALPSFFMVFNLQSSMGWRYVHADHFVCNPPDPLLRRKKAFILLCHLIPTSALGIACLIMYFLLRHRTATGFHRRIHYPLLIRLSALSALSGVGAALEFTINFTQFNRGLTGHIPSLYLISFPLVSAVLFVDKEIIKEWKSWLRLNRN
ncbi:hypothetical protein PtA15_4A473 [Puccinia triticina]|uniref:G-protein coupled receptors family 1 profile domain-containing protein n=1 Tax=Puccinia triticina TaxID=208348 RepID=A0ABY7CHS1_9BASI|nr:uncharacterized protein PtA15_4A473 [Puccinia triticina]WAQ84022.1 hypothetical protein PtA15_4A473 [Puccinia triticina]WAR54866.1 hypothetical protein PtB15_4B484 [Puccinia triticina]